VIHIDKNILDSIKEGDIIIIDSSDSILKVKKVDYYRNEKQNSKTQKQAKSFSNLPLSNINQFYDDKDEKNEKNISQQNFFINKNMLFIGDEESLITKSCQNVNTMSANNFKNKSLDFKCFKENEGFDINKESIQPNVILDNLDIISENNENSNANLIFKLSLSDKFLFSPFRKFSQDDSDKNSKIIELVEEESKEEDIFDIPYFEVDRDIYPDTKKIFREKQKKINEVYKNIIKKHGSQSSKELLSSNFLIEQKRNIDSILYLYEKNIKKILISNYYLI